MARLVKYSCRSSQPWKEVALFFTEYPAALDQLCTQIDGTLDGFNFETLTVGALLEACVGKIPQEITARYGGGDVETFARAINSLREGMELFLKFMERTTPPETIYQKKMSAGTLPANIEEAVLWTMKNTYTLHGLEDAQKLTVYEYMIARKEAYNEALVVYNKYVAAGGGR